jgi:hypothetical protein
MAYMKKVAKVDFVSEYLPKTRKAQFFDLIKNRFWIFIKIGLVLAIFIMPLIISHAVKDLTLYSVYKSFYDHLISEEELKVYIISITFGFDLLNIILLVVFAIGISGITRVFKALIWSEGVIFANDFITGIKQNGKKYCILFSICGVFILINNFMMQLLKNTQFEIMSYLPWSVTILMLLPIGLFYFSQIIYYSNSFKGYMTNAVRLYVSSFLKTLLYVIILIVPIFLIFGIDYIFVKYIAILLWTILILPIIICVWILYTNNLFDLYINVKFYPQIVKKGLFIDKE